ncbi:carbon-nitrogen hydrolase family protein [uncultured Algimonas sp.]|uniref:carbon-nitrogen hydrolase family protein n=1 Tax=uncultured Algimonas sp. TaxID=1547920 RepID=UPI0026363B06|nr:carbon-nitrogen hydrolase family protein [uncultured Algimonas sp.]
MTDPMPSSPDKLRVAVAQLATVMLDRRAGMERVLSAIADGKSQGADLICFPEAYLPGYPFWLSDGHGARFDDDRNKRLFAHYADQAVTIEDGHLDPICDALREADMAAWLGIVERPRDRSGHSLYCSYVHIDAEGRVRSVHRKLQPTYEERLVWSPGDGHGLVTHRIGAFTTGGLNCWENWMPLTRAALYAQGEDLHVAGWPGNRRNTEDLTPVLAKEGRSFVVSVCGVMRRDDVRDDMPEADFVREAVGDMSADGGSCVCAPDGSFLLEPWVGKDGTGKDGTGVKTVEIDAARVREERQNFDPSGHYSRPDVTRLHVDRTRQSLARFDDGTD